jgi:8-oxo-dGTP pyrophosphatase MutT (NUDIX family)
LSGKLTLPPNLSERLHTHAQQPDFGDSGWLHLDPPRLYPAAVLVPLIWKDNCWRLLFTRRTMEVEDHRGQVSFPGGARDAQDASFEQTALREAWEEVGIDPASVAVLGKMARLNLISDYQVTPVVGVVPCPLDLTINSIEVARAFTVPLDWLADTHNFQVRPHQFKNQTIHTIYYNEYDGEVIWGATAQITHEFLRLLQD